MEPQTRRDFLADVGKGMLTASIGTGLASGLGLSTALAEWGGAGALKFGPLEPLVELLHTIRQASRSRSTTICSPRCC